MTLNFNVANENINRGTRNRKRAGKEKRAAKVNLWKAPCYYAAQDDNVKIKIPKLGLFEDGSSHQADKNSRCLVGTSQIVIQCCTEGYDRGKRNRSKSKVDGCLRNPRPRLDIASNGARIQQYRNNLGSVGWSGLQRALYKGSRLCIKCGEASHRTESIQKTGRLRVRGPARSSEGPGNGQYKLRGLKFSSEITTKVELQTAPFERFLPGFRLDEVDLIRCYFTLNENIVDFQDKLEDVFIPSGET
ncbi:hypothetical protein J6590_064699 [Homalodisca vitripennis]|nr:hypothetical protein J6590_064699 [Homalodisca vitripennis]